MRPSLWKQFQKHMIRKMETLGVYDVEPEITEWAKLHAKFYIRRYKKEPEKHWKEGEERSNYVGMVGQKIFDVILQQLAIPKDHNDPIIDWRREKDYDFKIPYLGTVEVKCFDWYCEKVLIKISEWHKNDYCIIFKFMDRTPTIVHMMGWLTKEQVENLPISRVGETKYTPIADAYITDFSALNPCKDFFKKLKELSNHAK